MTRSALEVVTLYNMELWNKGRLELIPELCAERIVRHDANSVTSLDLDEQIARIRHNYEELRPTFEPVILAGDDEYITLVWNVTGRDPNWKWCGIEVFRVLDGKIVEVWNAPYVDGRWSQEGALTCSIAGAAVRALPVMSADIGDSGATLVAPLDAHAIATWLSLVFGEAETASASDGLTDRRFGWGGPQVDIALDYQEGARATRHLPSVRAGRLEIRWARSGLTNVTIDLIAVPSDGPAPDAPDSEATVRLAECFGDFTCADGRAGRIVGASIILDPTTRTASGEVTIRLPASYGSAEAICNDGQLGFGWRHEKSALHFTTASAALTSPRGAFSDGDEIEAVYSWTTNDITARLVNDAI